MTDLTRKQFLAGLGGGSIVLWLGGCGGGGDSAGAAAPAPGPAPAPAPAGPSCAAQIAENHGHLLVIPVADLDSTTAKSYDILGAADHSHTVTFTPAELALLKAGTTVRVTSTTTLLHAHQVTETCV